MQCSTCYYAVLNCMRTTVSLFKMNIANNECSSWKVLCCEWKALELYSELLHSTFATLVSFHKNKSDSSSAGLGVCIYTFYSSFVWSKQIYIFSFHLQFSIQLRTQLFATCFVVFRTYKMKNWISVYFLDFILKYIITL